MAQRSETTPLWERPVRESLIGRTFDANNKEWLNDFFKKHPVLTIQEKEAFKATQLAYDTLAIKFRGDLEISQAFDQAKAALQEKLNLLKSQHESPIELVSFLELYSAEIQTQLTEYAKEHEAEWGIIEETIGKLPDLTQNHPSGLWLFAQRFVEASKKHPQLARLLPILLTAVFVASFSLSCAAPSQDGLTAGGGAAPAVVAPEILVDLLNPDVAVSAGTPIVEPYTPTPTNTPIPPTPPPTETQIPAETAVITPTIEITATTTLTPTAVVTNTVEITPTVEVEKASLTVNSDILNVRDFPSAQNTNVIAQLKKGEVVAIIGKATNGWWYVELADGKTGWTTNGTKFVTATNTNGVEIVKTPEPPKVAPTATRNPEVATGLGTVKNTTDIPKKGFSQPNGDKNGEVLPVGASATVLAVQTDWIKIQYPPNKDGKIFWILSNNLSVIKPGGDQSPIATTIPVENQPTSNPVFGGVYAEDITYASSVDLRSGITSVFVYDNGGYLCQNPVVSVVKAGENQVGASFSQGVLFPKIGRVESAIRGANGSISVTFINPDGSREVRVVNSSTHVYLQTVNNQGNPTCIDTLIYGVPDGFFKVGTSYGFDAEGGKVLGAYPRG